MIFAETRRSLRADSGHDAGNPRDQGPDPIEANLDDFLSAMQSSMEEARDLDRVQATKDRYDQNGRGTDQVAERARLRLIRAIVDADPKPLPGVNEWYYLTDPLWTVRRGDKLLVLNRTEGKHTPDTIDQLVDHVTLTILPIASSFEANATLDPIDRDEDEDPKIAQARAERLEMLRRMATMAAGHFEDARRFVNLVDRSRFTTRITGATPADHAEADQWQNLLRDARCFLRETTEAFGDVIQDAYEAFRPASMEITDEMERQRQRDDDETGEGDWIERGITIDGVSYVLRHEPGNGEYDSVIRAEARHVVEL